ncbi:hypothetical protein ACFQ07_12885, partial [Actinomadura adrarensis]
MYGKREVDRAAERYTLQGLPGLATGRLLMGALLLMLWTLVCGAMVEEFEATRRAAEGQGVPGTFTARSESCSRSGCSWYGTFTARDDRQSVLDGVLLRGEDGRSVSAGDTIPALDVGSSNFVHMAGGSADWGEPFAAGFVGALAGGGGVVLIVG